MLREDKAKVETLIDSNSGWWDVQKVRRILPPVATDEVLKIIISLGNHEDKLI